MTAPRTGSTLQTWFPAAPWTMRDAAHDLLIQIPDFKRVFKTSPSVIAPEDLPCLVMDLQDRATAAGQGNQGALSFDHCSTLTLSIQCSADSNLLADGRIWELGETVLIQLLRNQDFPREFMEGIEHMNQRLNVPRDGETFLGVLNISMEITTRSEWEPIVPHKLRQLIIERRLTDTQTETALDEEITYPDWT